MNDNELFPALVCNFPICSYDVKVSEDLEWTKKEYDELSSLNSRSLQMINPHKNS